jgi:DNA-binding response OmpR family regulator
MIAIVSSNAAERAAFESLCASRRMASFGCGSIREAKQAFRSIRPKVIVARHQLIDGYSDDVLKELDRTGLRPAVKVIVLMEPVAYCRHAARQVALGADSVQQDPIRSDVLLEYLVRYRAAAQSAVRLAMRPAIGQPFDLAGAKIQPLDRLLLRGRRRARLTPREVQLAECLADSPNSVVGYTQLYGDLLGSSFRGDTSTIRVLLGKLAASYAAVGLKLRDFIEVIPKTGYRYRPLRRPSARSV